MMIIIPIIGYGLADVTISYLLAENPNLPAELANLEIAGLQVNASSFLPIGLTLLFSILLYLIFAVIASLLYSLMGGGENEEVISRIGSGRRRY